MKFIRRSITVRNNCVSNLCEMILIFVCLLAFACAEQYTDRYDDINLDEILQNKRLIASYVKCLLDQGRCTPEGSELRVHIKDGMQTGCMKCTDKQRKLARKAVNFIRENYNHYYIELVTKYDPKDENKAIYEAFLAADH